MSVLFGLILGVYTCVIAFVFYCVGVYAGVNAFKDEILKMIREKYTKQ